MNPLAVISALPPKLDEARVQQLLAEHYSVGGNLTPLISERDQNMLVNSPSGAGFVLKIANASEDPTVTDFQIQALRHLAMKDRPFAVPVLVPTLDGSLHIEISEGPETHIVRLVTYLDGRTMRDATLTPKIACAFGERLAQLDNALQDFEHAGEQQVLSWDMQRALQLRPLLTHINDTEVRRMTSAALDDFEHRALSQFPNLRHQVIHGDANPDNVLLAGDASEVIGFIDFGDMIRAPRIVDVAIAASYLRALDGDSLRLIVPFLSAYYRHAPFHETELDLLFDLIRTRLATTISILYWRVSARDSDDAYRQGTLARESAAQEFLSRLDQLGRAAFEERLGNEISD
jgi:hydroxylysine kinase